MVRACYTENDLIGDIRKEAVSIMGETIYFPLRKMKLKGIHIEAIERLKYCIVLDKLGLPITVPLLARLTQSKEATALHALHILGDKKVLTLARGSSSCFYSWYLSSQFKDAMTGETLG